mmetsp:Transcript_37368/g.81955  ORF Transcript_37368/g.81955 Transcript_37368/m.81955 type:complete len:98 (-) Transcript_37368:96-389(-)
MYHNSTFQTNIIDIETNQYNIFPGRKVFQSRVISDLMIVESKALPRFFATALPYLASDLLLCHPRCMSPNPSFADTDTARQAACRYLLLDSAVPSPS